MKQKIQVTLALICCLFVGGIFSACGGVEITSATVKSGTISTTIVKGEELDTSNIIAVVNYSNNESKEVEAEDLTISDIDSSKVGDQFLNLKYKDYSFKIKIKVVATESEVNSINMLESKLITDYDNNRKEQINKEEEFYDLTQPLYVGDDNKFNFRISASGTDGSGNLVQNLSKVKTKILVELKNGDNNFTELTGSELDNYVEIDTENTTLDFHESAINKDFRVTVQAANRDEAYSESQTKFTADLSVVDGFNVYTAKELSVYDNENKDNTWTDIKTEIGVLNQKVNAVILQNDISITKEDVPDEFFWKKSDVGYNEFQEKTDQTLEGSLKDIYAGLYNRKLSNGQKFNFIGNYFAIDLSSFPKMLVAIGRGSGVNVEGDEYMTGHSVVFCNSLESKGAGVETDTNIEWKNIYFIGNSELNADPRNSGGILLMKSKYANFSAYNTVAHNFYIGYFFEQGDLIATEGNTNPSQYTNNPYIGTYIVDGCKGYNFFQCHIYAFGAEDFVIKNSEFKNCGGPAIITDYEPFTEDKTAHSTNLDIINSVIESYVSGKEPWFEQYNAGSMFGSLINAEQLFNGYYQSAGLNKTGKSIVVDKVKDSNSEDMLSLLNLIAIMKGAHTDGMTNSRLGGYVRMFDTQEDYEAYYSDNKITTYGLDMDASDSVMKKAYGKQNYFQESKLGTYVNDGVAENGDATIYSSLLMANFSAILPSNPADVSSGFNSKSLKDQKIELISILNNDIQAKENDSLKLERLNYLYNVINSVFKITNWETLGNDVDAKLDAITNKINAIGQLGDYLNLYLINGMGAVIEFVDAE